MNQYCVVSSMLLIQKDHKVYSCVVSSILRMVQHQICIASQTSSGGTCLALLFATVCFFESNTKRGRVIRGTSEMPWTIHTCDMTDAT